VAADAHIGVLVAELRFPANRSLKDKRGPLSSTRDIVTKRFGASFSEVGFQETWQRARVLIVLAASSHRQAEERLDGVERHLHGQAFEVARIELKSVDAVEALWDTVC
jgi:uncharacterized protein YlxP (DUF503 family)